MKKSVLVLHITLSFLMISSFNQVKAQDTGSNQTLLEGGGAFLVTTGVKMKDAIGSPYLHEDFAVAKISSNTGEIYNARYNAFKDEIEIKVSEGKIQNLNKSISNVYITFVNDNLIFTPLNYINADDGLERGYFVTLTKSNQNVKIYAQKGIRYAQAQPAISGYDKDKPAEFKNKNDVYFVSINNAYARELPTKKKDIAKLFPNNSKEVLNFIKKNKIKTSREADLINLINYINTL